ncbi:TonB-linked SusC/RagA family outer membrane protein [Dysgonomonas sp. PFB1-18]|uniref:SusC/RagA family TonB-linked outer membrane protein n=1 Tax=unclassified Dysgonomonas TaxID=2630389 RepID=UPI00247590D6|nr:MULTISPECIES: TonB-dependent receptor [unclassified Dysgonomonas]MDH6310117.1 TonB-linked SusC/RagA family outer membrane protein [Dysgonomonas sp. PF1-14]MDH6340217.1 TonB-linked SusC/RagA family outer membrane protein [Dysgonomonas sp. PF1-16]MDH6381674.1 TonB-linked SusC/RagA family outer membrane protein [Dysgonomonas sp. PFB1-18]MDH6399033.1 TonB-linked SusC/RagA family outer membrane protein [Dysgonomonas sp. PF1-23]
MRNARLLKSFRLLFLFFLIPTLAFSQNISIQGVVKDVTGEGLPGVAVSEVGTSNGTLTDIDGNFSLRVAPNGKIKVSFISYKTQEIDVAGKTSFNIILEEDTKLLDEVVVVGYGQMKRSDLTGSVVSVTSDAVSKSVPTSIDQVLQGRAAGVQVQQNSGMPGGSSSIRIRGVNSLNASNEPIYVIDGVVIDGNTGSGTDNALSSINPSDIVSMDILKDASATAIYGSRGANGVIIITTKRGTKGDATISYNGYVGWQQMPKKLDLMNLRQYAEHKNERSAMGIVEWDDNFVRPDLLGKGTDWQDELFSNAFMTSHNLSVTGGNEKSSYALSAGYLDQEGIAVGSGFKRLNLSGSFDSQVKKYLKMGINFAFSNSDQEITVSDQSLIKIAMKQTPNVAVRNAEGNFDGPDTDEYVQNNPIGLAMIKENSNEKMGIRANTYAEATIIEGLTYKTELSFDYGVTNTYRFDPSYQFGAITNEVREGTQTKSYNKFWTWRNIATYNRTFGIHNVNAMLGQEMQKSSWEYLSGYRSGYLTNNATDLDAGDATTAKNNGSSGASSLLSYFGRVFYSFDNKYLLTATLRRDGSSKFHPDNRWGWFPSAALAWRVTGEEFLKDHNVIDNLKLRFGWGAVGNQNVSNYAYMATYSSVATNWGTGLLASNTPNPDLKWETTYSSNLGLDLNLFNNRIEFIADVYYKKTKNLLLILPLPSYVGTSGQGSATPPWANIGSLENKGLELTLNTVNIDKRDFQWRSNLVFSMNRNKVRSLDTSTSIINTTIQEGSETTVVTRTAVGEPIGQFYGYKVIGRFEKATDFYYKDADGNIKATALPKGMEIGENGMWIGDYIFEDVNKDGIIDEEDRTYIGNPEPKFTFGIGNTFTYKGFDLTIFLSGSYGNDVVNYQRRFLENPRENTNLLVEARDYAHLSLIDPNGPNDYRNVYISSGAADMPRIAASSGASTSNYRFSDKFVEDGSFLRIQNISLGYNLPRKVISKMGLQNLKVYMNLQNVHTFTKYSGYDPEVGSSNQSVGLTGIDNARYPSPRIYTFGMNVTF